MNPIDFVKEFWKDNKTNAIISIALLSVGSFIIYAKQHDRFTFDVGEFLFMLPFIWLVFFTIIFSMYLFMWWLKK